MSRRSEPDLLVLHAVRTMGYTDTVRIAHRLGLSEDVVTEHLRTAESRGWVTWTAFGDDGGWSLTEAGKAAGEALLAAELAAAEPAGVGGRDAVEAVYHDFLPVNELVASACTAWQLTEMGIGDGSTSLDSTLSQLRQAADTLAVMERRLTHELERFGGYHARFTAALDHASGDPRWIAGTDRDSAHRVWFELHEDLIATLGLTR